MNPTFNPVEKNELDKTGISATDVAIVGGGFAGSIAAIALARAGRKVTLIETNSAIPDLFRAEKLAGDQLLLLQELGVLEAFKAASTPVSEFVNIRGQRIVDIREDPQLNMLYRDMIGTLRSQIPSSVDFKIGRVVDIETSDDRQRVTLGGGEIVEARLVVLATGHGEALRRKLGFKRVVAHSQPTTSVGFTLTPPDAGFRFKALTAYGERRGDNVDYVSIFPIGENMRANLFMFTDIRDPRVKAIETQGMPALIELLPGLRPWIFNCGWAGDVATFPVEICKYENVLRSGIVVIGDAFRTSCPAVGTGLSCAMVDAVCLRDLAAQWFATPGMDVDKIAQFYNAPRKRERDFSTHALAFKRRKAVMDSSRVGELRQTAYYLARGLRDRLRRFGS